MTPPPPRLSITLLTEGGGQHSASASDAALSQQLEVEFCGYQGPVLVVSGDRPSAWLRLLRRDTWAALPDPAQPFAVGTPPALAPADAALAYANERPNAWDDILLCDPRTRAPLPGVGALPSYPLDLLWIDATRLLVRCTSNRLYLIEIGEYAHTRTTLYSSGGSCESLPGTTCVMAA